jgi:hypothetical protein
MPFCVLLARNDDMTLGRGVIMLAVIELARKANEF